MTLFQIKKKTLSIRGYSLKNLALKWDKAIFTNEKYKQLSSDGKLIERWQNVLLGQPEVPAELFNDFSNNFVLPYLAIDFVAQIGWHRIASAQKTTCSCDMLHRATYSVIQFFTLWRGNVPGYNHFFLL